MLSLEFARHRLRAFLAEISELDNSEFPYSDSRRALRRVKGRFDGLLRMLDDLGPGADVHVIKEHSNLSLESCVNYLPVLGFILRSTNVRNGFELVGPLRRLADQLLRPNRKKGESKIQLLLSSEWDYIPLFRCEADLPGFVMIGLPAHESSNPLLFPLCAHELGHALWGTKEREARYSSDLSGELDSQIGDRAKWDELRKAFPQFADYKRPPRDAQEPSPDLFQQSVSFSTVRNVAIQWATMQAEEIFCDFVGLRLFGRAYLLAFTHLLSPGNIGKRLPGYPQPNSRVEHMLKAVEAYSIPDPGIDADSYDSRPEWELPGDRLLMSLADDAVTCIVDALIDDVEKTAEETKVPVVDQASVEQILGKFRWAVPACGCPSLADILNAGWRVFEDGRFWERLPNIHKKKDQVLKELLLKNIELFELEQIDKELEEPDASAHGKNR